MKILIVSGFLGAGKTTFIKELIKKSKEQLVVLENEYGQNTLDSNELKNSTEQDLKLIDFMEGCVCCTQKDKFSNTILSISAGLDPDYLVVEPTGVGKLSNVMLAIEKISYEKIQLLQPIVVVCPETYDENLSLYGDICKDQIINASKVVLSKIEHSSPDLINNIKEKILAINPKCEVLTEHYSSKDNQWYEDLLLAEGETRKIIQDDSANNLPIDQYSLNNIKIDNLGQLIVFLEDIIHHEFGLIPRAKGIIQVSDSFLRFDVADGLYAVIEENDNFTNECVFIGRYINRKKISRRLGNKNYLKELRDTTAKQNKKTFKTII